MKKKALKFFVKSKIMIGILATVILGIAFGIYNLNKSTISDPSS